MTALVTGGAGFIGAHTCRALLDAGFDVRVLDDLSTGLLSNLDGLDVEVVEGSLTDADAVMRATHGVTHVVHLAARGSVPRSLADPAATHAANATGTLNVLEAVRESGAYAIVASSSSVYGANPELPKRERSWTQPISPYGASKLAAESYALAYRAAYRLPVLVLRFFNVYGPLQRPDHDYAAVIPRFAAAVLRDEPLEIHGDGRQTRDFTYVGSVVDVVRDSVVRGVTHDGPVNVAFGARVSVLDVARELEHIVGRHVVHRFTPARPSDVPHSENDPSLVNELFPTVVARPLREGLGETVAWMRSITVTAPPRPGPAHA